jgi:predicted metal-dependent peptidase
MSGAAPSPVEPGRALDAETATRLSAAKLWLVSTESPTTCGDMPYLASALYALVPVATTRVAAMTIDEHWRLYANSEWVAVTDIPQIGAELAHLVWHLLADHAGRARDLEVGPPHRPAWQLAADATVAEVVNGGAVVTGLDSPTDLGWTPGRSAEEYFALTSRLSVDSVSDADDAPGTDEVDLTCGSGCDGRARAYDLPPEADAGGIDAHDADALRRRVAIEFQEHQTQHGVAPGEWSRWVRQILDPVVPWQQVLAAAVRRGLGWSRGHTDYTYSRISRRQAGAGPIVLPALRRPVPEVAVVVDTSGSVDDGLLSQALGEVDGILAAQAVPEGSISVLAVDAAVHHVERVRTARDVRLGGGGGTNMGVGIDAALALKPKPSVIIVLTDGWTPWPALVPAAAVVVVLIGRDASELPKTPVWAQRVECVR